MLTRPLLCVCFALLSLANAAERGNRPNILLILADDLGWSQVSANGNAFYATPHLDRLAAEGVRFTAAYSAGTVCSPTRGALMTGQYPARTRVTDFIPGSPYPFARLRQPDWQKFLPLEATTIAELLAPAGYATAWLGKWHLARGYFPPESVEHGPDRQGFAETLITHKPDKKTDPEQDAHGVEKLTTAALAFLERHRAGPFFLGISHNSIHAPIMERSAQVARHRQRPGAGEPHNNPVIAAMMETLDASIGRLLARLDELGLAENTLVIFTSDNGGLAADARQTPLRGGKSELYEGGIRVPLFVRWRGAIPAGRVDATPVHTVDLLPTFLGAAGVTRPAALPLDGRDLLPLLRSGTPLGREALYWHYPHYHSAGAEPSGAIRAGDWKLIEYFEHTLTGQGRTPELFNLARDPAETQDLAAREPQRVAALLAQLRAWRTSISAQMPTPNSAHDPARARQAGARAGKAVDRSGDE